MLRFTLQSVKASSRERAPESFANLEGCTTMTEPICSKCHRLSYGRPQNEFQLEPQFSRFRQRILVGILVSRSTQRTSHGAQTRERNAAQCPACSRSRCCRQTLRPPRRLPSPCVSPFLRAI